MNSIPEKDKTILRRLAERKAQIAILPIQNEKAKMWSNLNSLKRVKPMVWINERPWHELGVECQLETSNPFCREIELKLRKILYQWDHMRVDSVVENKIYCPIVIGDTGFGIEEISRKIKVSEGSPPSREFTPQIEEAEDIEKIRTTEITLDEKTTESRYQVMLDIFGGIIAVEKRGVPNLWFAPWDELIRWWGVQQALTDLILRPDMVKAAMDRLVNAYLNRLEQYERLNLLSLDNDNHRVGSGGYGFTDELPKSDFNKNHIRPVDLWGCGAAQIFSEVSPEMHKEFAPDFELRWLKRFGLNYYGCCEPLHKKIAILKSIPNLRKISISPRANIEEAVSQIGKKYVLSYKPNPAIFAEEPWDPQKARHELRFALEQAKGCIVEVIMKDVSTIRNEPRRLWEWAQIATEVTEEFA